MQQWPSVSVVKLMVPMTRACQVLLEIPEGFLDPSVFSCIVSVVSVDAQDLCAIASVSVLKGEILAGGHQGRSQNMGSSRP